MTPDSPGIPTGRAPAAAGGDTHAADPDPRLHTDPDPTRAEIDTTILRQATWWRARTADGQLRTVLLDDLCTDHRRRVLASLRRHAACWQRLELDGVTRQYGLGALTYDDMSAEVRRLDFEPAVWIEDTQLVRRLVQLVGDEPRPPRRRRLLPDRLRRWLR